MITDDSTQKVAINKQIPYNYQHKHMNEEQQGFTCETKTEFIELNYIPIFHSNRPPHRPLPNNIKINLPRIQHDALVNHELVQSIADKFMAEHNGEIVFNGLTKRGVRFQSQIAFQSNFQGGNLEYVTQMGNREYHLFMRADTNTKGHHQWFYFKIKNRQSRRITLVLNNFVKSTMLYGRGLKPYVKSLRRGDLCYTQIQNPVSFEEKFDLDGNLTFSLKFQYIFSHLNDQIQFCAQPPYSHTKLANYLLDSPFKTINIGTTMMGHPLKAILLNQGPNSKALVAVIARQHPGQTVGSWLMEGFMNRLKMFESSITWLIVPMINVDGVMLGNNRTGILGYDFNRHWNADQETNKEHLFPEITGIVKYFKRCRRQKSKRIKLFLDLHGHSSEPNVFSYGPPVSKQSDYYQNSRLFPFLMSKRNKNFKLEQCSYQLDDSKKHCARSTFYHKLGFPYSYTIESSFGVYSDKAASESDMLQVGQDLCETSVQFVNLLLGEKKETFVEIIREMKVESQKLLCYKHCDSDSEDQEKEENQNMAFEKQVSSMLNVRQKPTVNSHRQVKKGNKGKSTWSFSGLKNTNSGTNSQTLVNKKRTKVRILKTESLHQETERRPIRRTFKLPTLSKQRCIFSNILTRRGGLMNKIKKLKEQEEAGVLTRNGCKIGKEIVILNGYGNY